MGKLLRCEALKLEYAKLQECGTQGTGGTQASLLPSSCEVGHEPLNERPPQGRRTQGPSELRAIRMRPLHGPSVMNLNSILH